MSVGEWRVLTAPPTLVESGLPSVHPFSGTWHVSQEAEPSLERRLSKKSCLPSITFSAVSGLSAGAFISSRPSGVAGRGGAVGIDGSGLAAAAADAEVGGLAEPAGVAEPWVGAAFSEGQPRRPAAADARIAKNRGLRFMDRAFLYEAHLTAARAPGSRERLRSGRRIMSSLA